MSDEIYISPEVDDGGDDGRQQPEAQPERAQKINHNLDGSFKNQLNNLARSTGNYQIGQSRHEAKMNALERLAERGESATKHNISQEMGIHSNRHWEKSFNTWNEIAKYAKENFGVKNIRELTGAHIRAWGESKIDQGVKLETLRVYMSYAERLGAMLNQWDQKYAPSNSHYFSHDIQYVREKGIEEGLRFGTEARAYSAPTQLTAAVRDERFRAIADFQRMAGARISEINLREKDLKGIVVHPTRGKVGCVELHGKGGKDRLAYVPEKMYLAIEAAVKNDGQWGLARKEHAAYGQALKDAAVRTGQAYNGSHGLRHSYAQARMAEHTQSGMAREVALKLVSQEMGHERPDITEHYMK